MNSRTDAPRVVLASRSPRRRELLQLLVPSEQIEVVPPQDPNEPGFDGLHDQRAIDAQLRTIASEKYTDVANQLRSRQMATRERESHVIIAADTAILVGNNSDQLVALGQPPDDDTYAETVLGWFRDYLLGRTHWAVTGMCVGCGTEPSHICIVRTEVRFRSGLDRLAARYIASGEPRGKAGGYAIQGAGSLFVESIHGSLTNVIGLPLNELSQMLEECGVDIMPARST